MRQSEHKDHKSASPPEPRRDRPVAPSDAFRLDRWIWFARFLRSREACADLVRAGHVRINGRRVRNPGHLVRIGDVLTLALPGATRLVRIRAFATRRGGPAEAKTLYCGLETEEPFQT